MSNEWVSSVRVSAPALMRVSSPGLQRAAPAWDTGEQTSRPRHQGRGRGEKTQVQTWVWHSLTTQAASLAGSEQWALYRVFTTQCPRHRRGALSCESRILNMIITIMLNWLHQSIRQETTETCCCFSEVSDSCQQQQQQQQHLLASQLWWTPDLRSPEWWQVNGEYTLIVIV